MSIAVLSIGISIGIFWNGLYSSDNSDITHSIDTSGLKTGDFFTYDLKAIFNLEDTNVVAPDYLYQYNTTEYYKVTIMQIEGANITFGITWKFSNGTVLASTQTINLATGTKTDQSAFAVVYASHLKLGDLLRPSGNDGLMVNGTANKQYRDSTRETNYYSANTQTDERSDSWEIYFDKQTGIMVNLKDIQSYDNPKMTITMVWKIVESNVWLV